MRFDEIIICSKKQAGRERLKLLWSWAVNASLMMMLIFAGNH